MIRNYFKDTKHDKDLSVLRKKHGRILYKEGNSENIQFEYIDIYNHKEGSIWHYIGQGINSYLTNKRTNNDKRRID